MARLVLDEQSINVLLHDGGDLTFTRRIVAGQNGGTADVEVEMAFKVGKFTLTGVMSGSDIFKVSKLLEQVDITDLALKLLAEQVKTP